MNKLTTNYNVLSGDFVFGLLFPIETAKLLPDFTTFCGHYLYSYRPNEGLLQWNLKTGDLKLLRLPFNLIVKGFPDIRLIENQANPEQVMIVFNTHFQIDHEAFSGRSYNQIVVVVDFKKRSVRFITLRNYHLSKVAKIRSSSVDIFQPTVPNFQDLVLDYEYELCTVYDLTDTAYFSGDAVKFHIFTLTQNSGKNQLWVAPIAFNYATGRKDVELRFEEGNPDWIGKGIKFINDHLFIVIGFHRTFIYVDKQEIFPRVPTYFKPYRLADVCFTAYNPVSSGFIFQVYLRPSYGGSPVRCYAYTPTSAILNEKEDFLSHSYYILTILDWVEDFVPSDRLIDLLTVSTPFGFKIGGLFEIADVIDLS